MLFKPMFKDFTVDPTPQIGHKMFQVHDLSQVEYMTIGGYGMPVAATNAIMEALDLSPLVT